MPAGFLLVMMQPPASLEEEFNAWYDTEHVPERLAVPGFRTAIRFVCLDGHPRYLAMYDLDDRAVLDSDAYMAVSGDRFSPWTRRVTSRVLVHRTSGHQLYTGDGVTGTATRVRLMRFRGLSSGDESELAETLRRGFEDRPETIDLRLFRCDGDDGHFAFMQLRCAPSRDQKDLAALGRFAGALDMDNLYAPYDPRI